MLTVLFGTREYIRTGRHGSEVAAMMYNAFSCSAFSLAICWVIVACSTGYGGPVNAVLSSAPMVVLGRLTYIAYLLVNYVLYVVYSYQEMGLYANLVNITIWLKYILLSRD